MAEEVEEVKPNIGDPIAVVNRVIEALFPLVERSGVEPADKVKAGRAILDAIALRETIRIGADPAAEHEVPSAIGDLFDNREPPGEDDE